MIICTNEQWGLYKRVSACNHALSVVYVYMAIITLPFYSFSFFFIIFPLLPGVCQDAVTCYTETDCGGSNTQAAGFCECCIGPGLSYRSGGDCRLCIGKQNFIQTIHGTRSTMIMGVSNLSLIKPFQLCHNQQNSPLVLPVQR